MVPEGSAAPSPEKRTSAFYILTQSLQRPMLLPTLGGMAGDWES